MTKPVKQYSLNICVIKQLLNLWTLYTFYSFDVIHLFHSLNETVHFDNNVSANQTWKLKVKLKNKT